MLGEAMLRNLINRSSEADNRGSRDDSSGAPIIILDGTRGRASIQARHRPHCGAGFLALLILIVISFSISMRTERQPVLCRGRGRGS
jgi:hypothetical protein